MLVKLLIISSLALILTSCNQTTRNDEKELEFNADSVEELTTEIDEDFIELPIDIYELKKLPFLETTSGCVTISETKKFCRPDTAGFFGHYQLLNKTNPFDYKFIGQLIVYTTDKPGNWRFDTSNETFIEIELKSPVIKVWTGIGVGTTETELLDFLKHKNYYRQDSEIKAEISGYSTIFYLISDTVNYLKISKYCNDK